MAEKVCGTCRWRDKDKWHNDWFCVCDESELCADWTGFDDSCGEWEGRKAGDEE